MMPIELKLNHSRTKKKIPRLMQIVKTEFFHLLVVGRGGGSAVWGTGSHGLLWDEDKCILRPQDSSCYVPCLISNSMQFSILTQRMII